MGVVDTRPTLLVDMDGVIAHWQKMFNDLVTELYPHIRLIPDEELVVFKAQSLYPAEHKADLDLLMNRPGFYRDLEPIEGAVQALHEMLEQYNVMLCTAPFVTHETCASEKMDWVGRHLGTAWKERMVITSDKTIVRGEILIDDKPAIKGSMVPDWTHIVFDAPYNRNNELRIDRWEDWRGVVEKVMSERSVFV